MEHIDEELFQNAPPAHLQAILRARRIPDKRGQYESNTQAQLLPAEVAALVLDPQSLLATIQSLDAFETRLLKELVACGGRANSRDLALYVSSFLPDMPSPENVAPSLTLSLPGTRGGTSSSLSRPSTSATGVPQYPVPHPHGPFEQAIRHLLLLGLLFWGKQTSYASRDYAGGIHDGILIVPEAVRDVVIQTWGQGEPFHTFLAPGQSQTSENGASSVSDEEIESAEGIRNLQRALYLYWSLVAAQRDGLALVNTGLLSRASLRQVLEHVGNKGSQGVQAVQGAQGTRILGEQVRVETDAPYLLFLRLLLTQLGLLQERNGAIYAINAEPFFRLPLAERARRCYDLWHDTPFWDEILYLPDVNVRPGPAPLDAAHEEIVRGRQTVVERIEYEELGAWHPLTTFIARTRLHTPYLLFPRHYGARTERYMSGSNPYGWDFRLKRGWLTPREGWHMVEGGFIRAIITGPLFWLGAIELDSEEKPTAFCLPSSSLFLLDHTPRASSVTVTGRLIVQPNFELVALAPVSESLLIALDRFADRVSLEHIAQYRISKASVTRAIQMGLHAADIQHILEDAAGGDIPQNIHYSLVEWERQARRIEVWNDAVLLEVEHPTQLDALFDGNETHALLRRRLTPYLAEVAPSQLEALQAVLWRQDALPVTSPAIDHDPFETGVAHREPQWQLHENGLLQPLYAVTDLYLLAALERFSDSDESTGWRCLTAASIQRAITQGRSLDDLLRFLNQYCRTGTPDEQTPPVGIPAALLIRLKLWGSGYGPRHDIAIETAPMLRLSSEILADLFADNELASLLNGEVEQQQRLVRVHPHALERVITLLRERGFTIEGE